MARPYLNSVNLNCIQHILHGNEHTFAALLDMGKAFDQINKYTLHLHLVE